MDLVWTPTSYEATYSDLRLFICRYSDSRWSWEMLGRPHKVLRGIAGSQEEAQQAALAAAHEHLAAVVVARVGAL